MGLNINTHHTVAYDKHERFLTKYTCVADICISQGNREKHGKNGLPDVLVLEGLRYNVR